jgi:hypothetical protein
MNKKILAGLGFCLLNFYTAFSQRIATFEIELTKPVAGLIVPARIELDAITFLPDSVLTLVQIKGNKKLPILCQVENDDNRYMTWLIEPTDEKEKKFTYELVKSPANNSSSKWIRSVKENGTLTIKSETRNLLRYQYKKFAAPSGVDSAYGRSAFIHPLWSPHGQVLTRIQPPDHYHHYGIWNPWTHVFYEGDTVDFWNLNSKQGTVRFANFLSTADGPVFSEYSALHEHVAFKKNGEKKVAMNEVQSVKIYQPADRDYYIADVTINLTCASESPVLLLAYRYGGLGWRTTEQWDRNNSEVLTSEGKNRKEADGSTARWCLVQGAVDQDYAGVVMMSYPTNYNHPEPLRIWPENQYDRGDMFANFSPTKNKNWLLTPGKVYSLKYRLIVFNGKFTKERAEAGWQYFSSPVKVKIMN